MAWDIDKFKLTATYVKPSMASYLPNNEITFTRWSGFISKAMSNSNYPFSCFVSVNNNYVFNGYRGTNSVSVLYKYDNVGVNDTGIPLSDIGISSSAYSEVTMFRFADSVGNVYSCNINQNGSGLVRIDVSLYSGDNTSGSTLPSMSAEYYVPSSQYGNTKLHFGLFKASDINFRRETGREQTNPDCVAIGFYMSRNGVAIPATEYQDRQFTGFFTYGFTDSADANGITYELNGDFVVTSPEYGTPSDVGGYTGGTFDDSSDTISIPSMPSIGISTAGFTNVYKVSTGELIGFGAELFPKMPDFDTSANTIPEVLNNIGTAVQSLFTAFQNSKLIDYVIDCHIIPVSPTTGGAENIKVAYKSFTQTATKVTSDYVDIDCGSLNVGEYYANFMDYGQFTTAKLYLPFVGFVPIQPEYWQSGVLSVTYRFNIIDGSFVAFVKSTSSKSNLSDSVIAQYGGNCCVHLPVTGLNYANMVSGALQTVPAVINSAKGGDISGAASNALNTLSLAPSMQSSNGYNSCTAFLGVRTPYLVIERAVSNFSQAYTNENGLPSNITSKFDTLTGYTVATAEIMTGFGDATEDEKTMILNALAEGTIF